MAMERILDHPYRWKLGSRGVRRVSVHRFPYVVAYRVLDSRIEVIAVVHQHRRPDSWMRRLDR
jgi:plasmid stabilization system protein ParE